MRKREKSMVDYFSPYTVAVSRLIVGMLMLLALYAGVRYPIPWLWRHLWKIVSLPLIVLWLVALVPVLCKLTLMIYPCLLAIVSLMGNALLYPIILLTHLPDLGCFAIAKIAYRKQHRCVDKNRKEQSVTCSPRYRNKVRRGIYLTFMRYAPTTVVGTHVFCEFHAAGANTQQARS